ncbi:AraC family transcriptional regulator [Piscinibacter sp.]|uniref:AraC family transcriptional regulator n=1 Tax=Piscinibacter sp. TaxID=1903157 RepID=UPI002B8A57B4|nr:helix-turn-helix domain-containing protein [Albitalea sp.]HUG21799.1 helix-turn-helix domain-containing protein [Albitalea sp.]
MDYGNPRSPPQSYLDALRCIDMARLRLLADEPPGDPARAVQSMVTAHSADVGFTDLVIWEQLSLAQEYYIPPNHSYEVFIREAAASPIVQWREGLLDIRHHAAGQIVVVPPYRAAYFRTFGPGKNLHLSVAPGLLARAADHEHEDARVRLRSCFGEHDDIIAGLGRVLLDYARLGGTPSRAFIESASVALAVRLLERFADGRPSSRRVLTPGQLARIDDYLQARMDQPASLQEMAQVVDLGPQAFHRAFKAATGDAPMRYAMQLRMRFARDLVEGTTRPIGDIASATGFSELAHFTNTFRRHWGIAPTRLRNG